MSERRGIFWHLSRFWSEERNLTVLLVIVVFNLFVLPPMGSLFGERLGFNLLYNLAISLLLLAGVRALTRHKSLQMVFAVIVALIILVRWIRILLGVTWLAGWDIFFSMVSALVFVVVVLGHVYKEGPITSYRIQGAIVAYLMIAMSFAMAYLLLEFLVPGSFQFPGGALVLDEQSWKICYYFSISTLTTLGYGDITPMQPVARSLSMVEVLIGQLYPAILLARMVTLHAQTPRSKKGE